MGLGTIPDHVIVLARPLHLLVGDREERAVDDVVGLSLECVDLGAVRGDGGKYLQARGTKTNQAHALARQRESVGRPVHRVNQASRECVKSGNVGPDGLVEDPHAGDQVSTRHGAAVSE